MLKLLNIGSFSLNSRTLNKIIFKSYKILSCNVASDYKSLGNHNVKTIFSDSYFEISLSARENGVVGNKKKYPYIWLRDNCKCNDCYDCKNQQTLVNLKSIPLNIKPNDISSNNDSKFTINCKYF